jgi:hypothetical protein
MHFGIFPKEHTISEIYHEIFHGQHGFASQFTADNIGQNAYILLILFLL